MSDPINVIEPTIGRNVWFRKNASVLATKSPLVRYVSGDQPFDATIVYVHNARLVNLRVTDHAGQSYAITSVPLLQEGDAEPTGMYCQWMPFQKGQARGKDAFGPVPKEVRVELLPPCDTTIEADIQAKGKTAARVTPADVEANISSEFYFTGTDGVLGASQMGTKPAGRARTLDTLTFCVLVLRNGFTVTGESACTSPENFDAEIGKKIARQNAVKKIWPLMGYELRSRLAGN